MKISCHGNCSDPACDAAMSSAKKRTKEHLLILTDFD